jgi:hypothetical protein
VPGLKRQRHSQIPRFLGSLFGLLFDNAGRERSDASPDALKSLRQLLYLWYKVDIAYEQKTKTKVLEKFIQTDASIGHYVLTDAVHRRVRNTARAIVTRVLSGLDPREISPAHGPGAVATGELGHQKSNFRRLNSKLESVYPFTEYMCFGLNQVVDCYDEIQALEVVESGTAKVVLVPKDSRGPRLISCEPLENQWIQQGIKDMIVTRIESHSLTRGRVNFTWQTINQALALEGSKTGEWSTLDMKDASDRVSLKLVYDLFCGVGPGVTQHREPTTLLEALEACRSDSTRLPDGRLVPLRKFAPMGSAVCFPVEALVFWSLAVSAISCYKCIPPSKAAAFVYVYGDDIILPTQFAQVVLDILPVFELEFNTGKCCTKGFFRESCGVDAYKGVVVTPIKIRKTPQFTMRAPGNLFGWCAQQRAFYQAGYWRCAEWIMRKILSCSRDVLITEPMILNEQTNAHLFWHGAITTEHNKTLRRRFCKKKHVMVYYVFGLIPWSYEYDGEDGWHAVLRYHARPREEPGVYAFPRRVRAKLGWRAIA